MTTMAALALSAIAAFAFDPEIKDIDILVELDSHGTATVVERWDVVVADGTEWYLVRDNLDGMTIRDLAVLDEKGLPYENIGEWDVNRSLKQKAGKCGIVTKSNGCEICWGVGSYGPHKFAVCYRMTGAVRAMDDYDCLHLQFVSPGLSARPKHVCVTVTSQDHQLDTTNTRVWGFGYVGTTVFDELGHVRFESSEQFRYNSSVIGLMRFDKTMFAPSLRDEGSFQKVLDRAMDGASFEEDEDDFSIIDVLIFLLFVVVFFILPIYAASGKVSKRKKRKILGCRPKEVQWYRDAPCDGDLAVTEFILKQLGEQKKENTMASALILRMIYKGALKVSKDANGKVEIAFGAPSKLDTLPVEAHTLYNMMMEASGSDLILQDKEFSKWSERSANKKRIRDWSTGFEARGKNVAQTKGWVTRGKFSPEGSARARETYGFQKFLREFTLVEEKTSIEVHMWQEYLVYAALFGIAEKVAKELKDIDTNVSEQVLVGTDPVSMYDVIRMTNRLSNAITNARVVQTSSGSAGGFGGHSSFGGGGGFHGGGFGGGSR